MKKEGRRKNDAGKKHLLQSAAENLRQSFRMGEEIPCFLLGFFWEDEAIKKEALKASCNSIGARGGTRTHTPRGTRF